MRPGPKPGSLEDMGKKWVAEPPLQRTWHGVSPHKKLQIILYLMHHRIETDGSTQRQRTLRGLEWDGLRRPPTAKETSAHFKVPERTVRDIWYSRETIVAMGRSGRQSTGTWTGRYPKLDSTGWGMADDDVGEPIKLKEVEGTDDGSQISLPADHSDAISHQRYLYRLMTIAELKGKLKQQGLKGYSSLNKSELIERLLELHQVGLAAANPIRVEHAPAETAGQHSQEIMHAASSVMVAER
jgi:hypothetical protein